MIITHYPWCTCANPHPQTLRPMAQRVQQAHWPIPCSPVPFFGCVLGQLYCLL